MQRDQFFAGLFIVAAANGLVATVIEAVHALGWSGALLQTFNVSALVWFACIAAPALILKSDAGETIKRVDLVIAALVLGLALVPLGKASWFAVSVMALYLLAASRPESLRWRSALIMLALTGPMLWGPILMGTIGLFFVRADAILVAMLIGTERFGNVVRFVDASGTFQITPGCSSLEGMSLAILAWVTTTQLVNHTWRRIDYLWCLAAAGSVLIINIVRLSLIGSFPKHFDVLHGPVGEAVLAWVLLGAVVTICLLGVRRELFARA